ncbi:c-type cytochrome [Cognatishimia sp. F0-27]|nr:c-type cytochrome [Cognatishimia sp. F0-27]
MAGEDTAAMPTVGQGMVLYQNNCAMCHGETGIGDGPMARAMTRAPANLTLISLRNNETFPRARVMSTIDGYARSDMDTPGMPEFGDLLDSPLVPFDSGDGIQTPTPRKLVAILEYIESIQKTR